MPWRSSSVPAQRFEFVRLAEQGGVSFVELCHRFGIARSTGYKWLGRYEEEGPGGLTDRSRRPRSSPVQTDSDVEELVCGVRRRFPAWGGRKIRGFLMRQGHTRVPAASTITVILRRNGLMEHEAPPKRGYVRFERAEPNELWAMDFKGDFALTAGGRCYPFGVIDDYSRYSIALAACPNYQTATVKTHLTAAFERYGLPQAILMDNGPPWGATVEHQWNPITVWLCDLGIDPIHLGVLMVVNMQIGLVTPPVGLNLFVTAGVANMSLEETIKASLPWLAVLLAVLMLITFVPWISLVIPTLIGA